MEITNNLIKMVSSLSQKKHRVEQDSFVAEGTKCVLDTIDNFNCKYLLATHEWILNHENYIKNRNVLQATRTQLNRMSQFSTASDVIAIYELPKYSLNENDIKNKLTIVLDGVQDPGNLGTIIRLSDWYGVKNIICSVDSVDAFSHKVIQATMGAISRVKIYYMDLQIFFENINDVNVYGTFLDGENIYGSYLDNNGIIIFGNEGKGISPKLERYINKRLLIPPYPANEITSESLNVGVAAAITISEFRRKELMK